MFFNPSPISQGPGEKNKSLRAVGHTIQLMEAFQGKYSPHGVKLVLPPKKQPLSSRIVPKLTVPQSEQWIFDEIDACEVSEEHLKVLYWLRKCDFVRSQRDYEPTEKSELKMSSELRARVVALIFSGQWVSDPEHSDLQNLNLQLKIIDLGRYNGLNPDKPIPERFQRMHYNYSQAEALQRKEDAKIDELKKLDAIAPVETETAFQKANRLRIEKGLEDFPVPSKPIVGE